MGKKKQVRVLRTKRSLCVPFFVVTRERSSFACALELFVAPRFFDLFFFCVERVKP